MNIRAYQGEMPEIGDQVYIDPTAVVVGKVKIGNDASLWPQVAARGDVNSIEIGSKTNIQDNTVLHVTHDGPYSPGGIPLIIGDEVTVGHSALLHACTIGNRVLVGMGAIVMDGVVVEDEVMIAAGSLVTPNKKLESGYLYSGSPVRQIRKLAKHELEMLEYSAAHYVRLKDKYLAEVK